MKYIVSSSKDNTITCEHVGTCGSCRVKEHSYHDCLPGDTLVGENGSSVYCIGCGEKALTADEATQLIFHSIHEGCRTTKVANIATRFGGIDGAHHKQWVIDQMLRVALGKHKYEKWLTEMNSDPEYGSWDHGTPP